jgi:hypothetical protein
MSRATVKVDGLPELIRGLRDNAGLAQPFAKAFGRIGLEQQSASIRKAPRNFGKLQNSIVFQVDKSPFPTFVRIGTIGSDKPAYAAYMEFGTGLVHDHPSWPRKVHKVPGVALALWGKRKGVNPYAAAKAITKRGGLTPRRYLRDPFERNKATYIGYLQKALKEARLDG